MTATTDFTDDEWAMVRNLPWQAGIGVIAADPSGPVATGRELRAVAEFIRRTDAHGSHTDLVRLVADDLAGDDGEVARPDGGTSDFGDLSARALEASRMVVALLEDKHIAPGEIAGYTAWIAAVAERVAEASREGLFGSRVSDAEETFLADLGRALGRT